MFPSSGKHVAQTTSTPSASEFPCAFVTAAQEEMIVNTSFQVALSPHTYYAHTASSGQAVVGHPGTGIRTGPSHNQVIGMGPSHIQVTGMSYPGNQMQLQSFRSPSAPILLQPLHHSLTTPPQLLHSRREQLAESSPVLRSNTTPISHPPQPVSSLLTQPFSQPTNRQPLVLAPLRAWVRG